MSAAAAENTPLGATRAAPPLWVAAFAVAAAFHVGALALFWWTARTVDASDALGAPAIEISLDLAAPREEDEALPPGPVADEAAASVAAAEQHEKAEDVDAPKETPHEAPDAERVVAPTVTAKKETEAKVETKTQAATESVASEAAAPPKIEGAKEAQTTTAPAQGTGASAAKIRMAWQTMLVAHINRHKRYPAGASRTAREVTVTFTLDRLGHVVDAFVRTSSGDPLFDQAALAMMRRADPLPAPPARVADEGLIFSIPIVFEKRGRGP